MTIHRTTRRVGDTLHVLVAGSAEELARLASRLLKPNGHAVVGPDGASVHVVDEEIHPAVWDAAGNRVRANRVRVERAPDGTTTRTVLRTVWVDPA